MYIIVGLGNPEPEYSNTRHNMGFDTINKLAKQYEIDVSRTKFNGLYGSGVIEKQKVILLKPQTFMNLSGECVKAFVDFYKLQTATDVIVVYDDMDIEPGTVKIKKKGGPGSHNGAKSVVHELENDDFMRIRIGIGKPEEQEDRINYVIGKLQEEEGNILQQGIELAVQAIVETMKHGIDSAMNKYN